MKTYNLAFLILFMITCDKTNPAAEESAYENVLTGKWKAVSLFLSDATTGVCHQEKTDRDITIEFTVAESNPVQYKISGQAPINNYFAGYQLIGFDKITGIGKLKIEGMGSTKMGGPPEMMDCEQNYFNFLSDATGFQIEPSDTNILKIGRIKEPGSAPTRDGGTYYIFEKMK